MQKDDVTSGREIREAKRTKPNNTEGGEGVGFGDLPYELTLFIIENAAGKDLSQKLQVLKNLRLVSRDFNQFATDVLLHNYIQAMEEALQGLNQKLSEEWSGTVGELKGQKLEKLFTDIAKASEELQLVKKAINDKKAARRKIFELSNVDWDTKTQLLKACTFDPELLILREVAESVKRDKKVLAEINRPTRDPWEGDPLAVPSPFGPTPPFGPGRPYGPRPRVPPPFGPGGVGAPPDWDRDRNPPTMPGFFGEPEPDHLRPPDWERDRNPPTMPGMPGSTDPFGPFGGTGSGPNPFNPRGGGAGGFPRGPRFL